MMDMKRFPLLLAIACPLILASCGTSKFYSQNADSIRPIALVQPFSYLTDAIADFSTTYAEEPSKANNEILSETIAAVSLPVEKVVPFTYDYANSADKITVWMRQLADVSSGIARTLAVPTDIREAVRKSGCRYGMVLSDIGYVKNPSQYQVEQALEIGMKALDLIANNSLDLSKDTNAFVNGMFSLIFDSETGEIVWFGSCPRDYKHNPIDRANIKDQVTKLYKAFL